MSEQRLSTQHHELLNALSSTGLQSSLIIQDLDGVCMGLVRDPLTRQLDPEYVHAAHSLGEHFRVLTNGEHIGHRGVNSIVENAIGDPEQVAREGLYLPGLAAGGIQMQDRHARVSHPGLNTQEKAFLQSIPDRASQFLQQWFGQYCPELSPEELQALLHAAVLDNAVSPTLNINAAFPLLAEQPSLYRDLQQQSQYFLGQCLADAAHAGMPDSFFIHMAPNLGRDRSGYEIMRPAEQHHAGTTDFQFMVKGAVKEAGVLVLLNQYVANRFGKAPLGERFHVRDAPRSLEAQLELVVERFDAAQIPRLIGVGDTVSSSQEKRGGSDRGFLHLIQEIGARLNKDNAVLFVDSSAGEVLRPGIDQKRLANRANPISALEGITDPRDRLKLNFLFPGGHVEYVEFFKQLAAQASLHCAECS